MECLLEELKAGKPPTKRKQFSRKNSFNSHVETEQKELIDKAQGADMAECETELRNKLAERQTNNKLDVKFEFVNLILLNFSKSTKAVNKIRNLRLYFLFILFAGNLIHYVLPIQPITCTIH